MESVDRALFYGTYIRNVYLEGVYVFLTNITKMYFFCTYLVTISRNLSSLDKLRLPVVKINVGSNGKLTNEVFMKLNLNKKTIVNLSSDHRYDL